MADVFLQRTARNFLFYSTPVDEFCNRYMAFGRAQHEPKNSSQEGSG